MTWRPISHDEVDRISEGTRVKLIMGGDEYMGCIGRPQPVGGLLYFQEDGFTNGGFPSQNSGWVHPENLWVEN